MLLSQDDFLNNTYSIGCSKDVDFTIFWGDVRAFTSVKNNDGILSIGTHEDAEVMETVLERGLEYYYKNVDINNCRYVGFYIPIVNSSAKTVGGNFDAVIDEKTQSRKDEVGQIAVSVLAMKKSLRDLIEHDLLNSLLKRRSCCIVINEIISRDSPHTTAMRDINFFKKINDSYGHACGDMVLKRVSAIISGYGQNNGFTVSRWGREEFHMIFPDKGLSAAQQILEDIMDTIRNTAFEWEGQKVAVTMTIGTAQSVPGETTNKTINRADGMLYDGKRSCRNRIATEYTKFQR